MTLVGAYLARLGCERAPEVTAASLARLHRAHLERVPFENLDIHLGVRIGLDSRESARKIAERGAGVLLRAERRVRRTARRARVHRRAARGARAVARRRGGAAIRARVPHRAPRGGTAARRRRLRPGFDEPLAFAAGVLQADTGGTLHAPRRWRAACSSWCTTRWRRTASSLPRSLANFADGCDYQQTSPDSIFTRNPVCTIRSAGGRTTLSGLQLIETSDSGLREERAVGAASTATSSLRGSGSG